jgi:hypothetical protein
MILHQSLIPNEPPLENATRVIVYAIIFGLILYDLGCAIFGWATITRLVREIDAQCGGLIRWGWLALWLHFWGPFWITHARG